VYTIQTANGGLADSREQRKTMSGRPALLMSRDVKQVCIGAKRAGATRVEIPIRGTSVIVHFDKADDTPVAVEPDEQIKL
jgi:hypothetical protein